MRYLALNEPSLGTAEIEAAVAAIAGGYISTAGPLVTDFEEKVAERVGTNYAIATSSGTSALHLSFEALGIGPGSLVAVADLTFIASANAVAYTGADLLLVDSERQTWNLDGAQLLDYIDRAAGAGKRLPAAIEVVHILGHPVDWSPFEVISERYDIPIIEDASEAFGAGILADGRRREVGTLGKAACLSFNGNKIITTGGGGMVVTDDRELAESIRHRSTQAKLAGGDYSHDLIGHNYRLPALLAAVGIAQLGRLDGFLRAKAAIRGWYEVAMAEYEEVDLAPVAPWAMPSYWLISATVPAECRDEVVGTLAAAGIGARPIWRPMSLQLPYRAAARVGGSVADDLFARGISLPSSADLSEQEVQRVATVLGNAVRRAKRS